MVALTNAQKAKDRREGGERISKGLIHGRRSLSPLNLSRLETCQRVGLVVFDIEQLIQLRYGKDLVNFWANVAEF